MIVAATQIIINDNNLSRQLFRLDHMVLPRPVANEPYTMLSIVILTTIDDAFNYCEFEL